MTHESVAAEFLHPVVVDHGRCSIVQASCTLKVLQIVQLLIHFTASRLHINFIAVEKKLTVFRKARSEKRKICPFQMKKMDSVTLLSGERKKE